MAGICYFQWLFFTPLYIESGQHTPEPVDYDRGATVNIPLDNGKDSEQRRKNSKQRRLN
ncbi:hypothetical protein CsSME_00038239 [Camellia sinensis var. sinensis]